MPVLSMSREEALRRAEANGREAGDIQAYVIVRHGRAGEPDEHVRCYFDSDFQELASRSVIREVIWGSGLFFRNHPPWRPAPAAV